MKKTILLFFFLLGTTLFLAASPAISLDDQISQGEVLRVLVWDTAAITNVNGQLQIDGRNPIRVKGFPVFSGEDGVYAWVLLFGIDSGLKTGPAVVLASAATAGGNISLEKQVTILEGDFISEDIPLNEAMSDLRQSEDPEKIRQSRVLTEILFTFNPDSVFLDGALSFPLTGKRRTSFFGDRRRFLYTDGGIGRSVHYGLDFSANPGTPIASDGPGRVVFSDFRIISGHTVVVEHLPGVYSLYYHMSERKVNTGDFVEAGALIGTVGATGLVTGAHLHWEIRVNGVAVSPDYLVRTALVDKAGILSIVKNVAGSL